MTKRQYKNLIKAGQPVKITSINNYTVAGNRARSWRTWATIALVALVWLAHALYDAATEEQEFRATEAGRIER